MVEHPEGFSRRYQLSLITPAEAFSDPLARRIPDSLDTQFRIRGLARLRGYRVDPVPRATSKETIEKRFRRGGAFR